MSILGVSKHQLDDAFTLSLLGTGYLTDHRDFLRKNWDEHKVQCIAGFAFTEAAFALLCIPNTIETIASAIAFLVVSGAYFFIPPSNREQFTETVCNPVRLYTVTSLLVTLATYISLFTNCTAELMRKGAFETAANLFS